MKILIRISTLWLLGVSIISCSEDNDSIKTVGGHFKLVQIQSAKNARTLATSDESTTFDLGDLRASKEFYFLLQSTGGTITDITLETDNPSFTVTPESISELEENGAIMPLISVGITHGIYLNGFGFTDILNMGEQSTTLTIRGKTVIEGNLVDVESVFTFRINAKVMDARLFDDNSEIDFTSVFSTTSGVPNAGGLGAVRGYLSQTGIIKIENTGNVDIRVRGVANFAGELFVDESVAPGESISFDITGRNYAVISLDGNGTITDNNKIQMGNDGKGYFGVEKALE